MRWSYVVLALGIMLAVVACVGLGFAAGYFTSAQTQRAQRCQQLSDQYVAALQGANSNAATATRAQTQYRQECG